jgi:heat shock protein HslJ
MTGKIVAAMILIVGCRGPASSQPTTPPSLEGTAWKLAALSSADLAKNVSSTITFGAAGALSGSDGCNRFRGTWTTSGSSLTLTPGAATRMACPEPIMTQAGAFTAALSATRGYTMDAGKLVLTGSAGARLATFVPSPVASLQGGEWRATMVNNGKGAVASLLRATTITAAFHADGRLSGGAGCNRYTTTYTTGGDAMTIAPAAVARNICPAQVMTQERSYLAALARTTTYRLGEDTLELRDAKGSLQASFRLHR